ncbi:hypothetical protein AB0L20_31725 [Streptomyces albidoflavus]|uniref:hypothetical protein n=1 Tax=Streptomyces albidoflavus TaxID=1886 RepID=UPI0034485E27
MIDHVGAAALKFVKSKPISRLDALLLTPVARSTRVLGEHSLNGIPERLVNNHFMFVRIGIALVLCLVTVWVWPDQMCARFQDETW